MELNRNHCFMIGLILLFLGIQFRMVESVTLNAKTSEFIARRLRSGNSGTATDVVPSLLSSPPPASRRTITPPNWLGWCLVSAGSVLVLHSLVMPRPQ